MNRIKKQWQITVLLFLTVTALVYCQLVYSESDIDQATERTIKASPKEQKKNSSNTKQKNLQRPADFIPSEKIKADSSVSFPVDI